MIEELAPLADRAEMLRDVSSALGIYLYIRGQIRNATTPSLAQAACENVAIRCHVRCWGDMDIDFGEGYAWWNYLSELKRTADSCFQTISGKYS